MAQPILAATGAQVRSLSLRSSLSELSELYGAALKVCTLSLRSRTLSLRSCLWNLPGGASGSGPQTPKQSLPTRAVAKMTAVKQTPSNYLGALSDRPFIPFGNCAKPSWR